MDISTGFAAYILFFGVIATLAGGLPLLGVLLYNLLKVIIKQEWLAAGLAGVLVSCLIGFEIASAITLLVGSAALAVYAVAWYTAWTCAGFLAGTILREIFKKPS